MLNLFFPKLCRGCENELLIHETNICTYCRHHLPVTNIHFNNSDEVKKIFYGRVPVVNATALLYFKKHGLTQKFVHAMKYKGAVKLSNEFGRWLGSELSDVEAYQAIDAVIPIPLHKNKLRQRGYNQVEGFGKEIATALSKPYIDTVLKKITPTKSQVFKERVTRLFSQEEVFTVQNEEKIKGKHLLIVDDIITSGATLESCAAKLLKTEGVRLSFAAIALTK